MIEAPQGTLATPLGCVRYAMTEAGHVFLHTESRHDEAITIRGIRYHASFHCHLINGQWGAKDWHEPYLSRKDNMKEPSQAARRTAGEVLAKAWADYLADHPSLSRKAELAKTRNEVEHLEGELTDLEEKADAKRKELADAKARLAAI
jgi:hypothetical protein